MRSERRAERSGEATQQQALALGGRRVVAGHAHGANPALESATRTRTGISGVRRCTKHGRTHGTVGGNKRRLPSNLQNRTSQTNPQQGVTTHTRAPQLRAQGLQTARRAKTTQRSTHPHTEVLEGSKPPRKRNLKRAASTVCSTDTAQIHGEQNSP